LAVLPEKSILLVEDSALVRFATRRALEEKGYLVDEAASGQEALARAREKIRPYDLVILDIHLPGMDGLTVLDSLKRLPEYRHVPVMVVTVESKVTTIKQAIELGAVEYLIKPFSEQELVRRVKKLLGTGARKEVSPLDLLRKVLRNEINRANRGGSKATLVLIVVEGVGRGKIIECAEQASRQLREIDTVMELGENTIALVLPLTGRDGAQVVVNKLELAGVLQGVWTCGIAVYPDDGENGEELLARAEASLREKAKEKAPSEPS